MANNQIEIKALIRSDLDTGGIVKKVSNIQQLLQKLNLPPTLQKEFNGLFTDFNTSIDKINQQFQKGFETKGAVKSLDSMGTEMRHVVEKIADAWQDVSSQGELIKLPSDQIQKLQNINNQIQDLSKRLKDVNPESLEKVKEAITQLKGKAGQKAGSEVMKLIDENQVQQAINLLNQFIARREKMKIGVGQSTLEADTEQLRHMKDALVGAGTETKNLINELEQLNADKAKIMANALNELAEEAQRGGIDVEKLSEEAEKSAISFKTAGAGAQEMNSELDQIKDKIKYFFSLNNAIQLVRQALRQTFEAAKELDAAMTETAVVTDFSVSDMWDMLPKYTKTAQELGATTQGVYETLTLFYQQGLDTNEAMALGTETLKMARIAGMDYEEATSKMTAALRGFNMELDETSAKRVNDVYSELAAITAADTDQIATAMTKTASIAKSANMEFETTAAFLSQIIETTQESAETAGTAMKTVIARFTELKKDPSLIGEVDGEVIDANKIETALNSIGVALRDNLTGQFRDLDDVFLNIAQKWEGLDTNTQRYIATIAAGSRQQSRFIAMMSDYERTMELVSAANDSAGSSQAQFDKTLESMEAKLNQLKNTWQEFTLGLADNELLKNGIDALNNLLTVINKFTNAPGVLGSASKAFAGFFTLFVGKKLFNIASKSIIPNLVGPFTGAGAKAGMKFTEAFVQEFSGIKKNIANLFGKNLIDPRSAEGFKQIFQVNYTDDTFAKMTKSVTDYAEAQTKLSTIERMRQSITEKNIMTEGKRVILEKASTVASLSQANAENVLAAATGLSNVQAAEALAMTQAGIPIDAAAAMAKYNITAATVAQKLGVNSLTDAKQEEISATVAQIIAENSSLLSRTKNLAILLFSTNQEKRLTAARNLSTTSTWAAKIAQDGLNSAFLACPIGWIIAGILAVTAAIVGLVVVAKHFSIEEQLERATESANQSTEAIEQAKEAYEGLLNTIEDKNNAADAINNLTKGTVEFKQAVQEANLSMLELLNTYPKLRQEGMTFYDENGVMRLTAEGESLLKDTAAQQLQNTQGINTVAQISLNNMQKKAAGEGLESEIRKVKSSGAIGGSVGGSLGAAGGAIGGLYGGVAIGTAIAPGLGTVIGAIAGPIIGAIAGGISTALGGAAIQDWISSDKVQDKITEKLEEEKYNSPAKMKEFFETQAIQNADGTIAFSKEFEDFAKAIGLTAEELYELKDNVIGFSGALEDEDQENKAIIKEQLRATATEEMLESSIFDKVADIYAEANKDQAKITEEEIKDTEAEVDSKAGKKALAEQLDLDVDLEGLSEEAMAKRLYSAITGIPEQDITLSKDDIEIELAKVKIANKSEFGAEAMAEFYDNLSKISEDTRADIETILSGDIDFTADQLNKLFQNGEIDKQALYWMKRTYEATYGDVETNKINIQRKQTVSKSEGIIDSTSSALNQLFENGKIEDETALLATLGQVEGLYQNLGTAAQEWGVVSNKGIVDQISYLTKLSQIQYNQKEEAIAAAKEQREGFLQTRQALQAQLDSGKGSADYLNGMKDKIEEIDKTLASTDWVLDIKVTDNFDQIETQVDNLISSFKSIAEATKDLEEGFSLSANSADALSEAFPGILENATIAYDGTITLNEETRKEILKTAEAEMKASAETQKAIVKQEIAKLKGFIERKELELSVVKTVLEQGNEANAAAMLADLANEGEFSQMLAQYESDRVKTHENALGVQGDNFFEEKEYELGLQDKAGIEMAKGYTADVLANKEAADIKTEDQVGFFTKLGTAIKLFLSGDWSGGLAAIKGETSTGGAVYYKKDGTIFTDDDMKDRFGSDFEVVREADGTLSSKKTLSNYFNQEYGTLEQARTQLKLQQDNLIEIDAYAKDAIYQLQNPGSDSSDKKDKEDEKWEYKRDYDENIKAQLKGKENDREILEAQLEALVENENATIEDIIAKKTEIAAVGKQQLKLLKDQLDLDLQEVENLKNQHSEWADLYNIDENGVITWDEDKINAMNLTTEQGEEFDEWSENLTTAVENSAATALDIVNISNEINSFLAPIVNEFDEIYNNERKIKNLQEKRVKLEQEFEKLLSSQVVSLSKLVDNLLEQSTTLEEEKKIAQDNLNIATSNLMSKINSNDKFSNYYSYNASTNQLTIDSNALDKLAESGQDEAYEEVKEFLEGLEKKVDSIDEYTSDIYDIESKQLDIQQKGKDSYSELETNIYEGIIKYMENQISELGDLYDSVNDSNSRIIDSINEALSLQRQNRTNEKTEQELGDLRNRIAYLSMDTSGRNQSEILNLQKQLEEKEQDYTDTLIDQKISELQKQNDIAAEQREYQISLLTYQHEQAKQNGAYLAAAELALQEILSTGNTLDEITIGSLGNAVNNALGSSNGGTLAGLTDDTGSIVSGLDEFWPEGKSLADVLHDDDDRLQTSSEYEKEYTDYLKQLAYVSAGINEARKNITWQDSLHASLQMLGLVELDAFDIATYDFNSNGEIDQEDLDLMKGVWKYEHEPTPYRAFATGGLADYTGPAWLDGTKSRPELVLNQTDTQNFLALKDILSSFMSNNTSTQNSAEKGGDNYYEIHLEVEKITSDYDVEQLANKVKSIIAEDANSRGVNSIYRRR